MLGRPQLYLQHRAGTYMIPERSAAKLLPVTFVYSLLLGGRWHVFPSEEKAIDVIPPGTVVAEFQAVNLEHECRLFARCPCMTLRRRHLICLTERRPATTRPHRHHQKLPWEIWQLPTKRAAETTLKGIISTRLRRTNSILIRNNFGESGGIYKMQCPAGDRVKSSGLAEVPEQSWQ